MSLVSPEVRLEREVPAVSPVRSVHSVTPARPVSAVPQAQPVMVVPCHSGTPQLFPRGEISHSHQARAPAGGSHFLCVPLTPL